MKIPSPPKHLPPRANNYNEFTPEGAGSFFVSAVVCAVIIGALLMWWLL